MSLPLATRLTFKVKGFIVCCRRFHRRLIKARNSLLTIEIDVYSDWTLDFLSVSAPGDFERVRHAMSLAIKKLQQQMRDQQQCPFHPLNYPDDASNQKPNYGVTTETSNGG